MNTFLNAFVFEGMMNRTYSLLKTLELGQCLGLTYAWPNRVSTQDAFH